MRSKIYSRQISQQYVNFVCLQMTTILTQHLVVTVTVFTWQPKIRNIIKHPETQFEHSMFTSG